MPTKNRPAPARIVRPSRGVDHDALGQSDEEPGDAVEDRRSGRPERQVRPGAKIPPKASPNDPDDQAPPHAAQSSKP